MLDTLGIIQSFQQEKTCRFVFPSDMAAKNAAERLARTSKAPVAMKNFIAWDRFKELTLSGSSTTRIPANGLIRRLFTNAVFEENARKAKEGDPLFKDLIPPIWSHNYSSFIEGTASILSILGPLKNEIRTQSSSVPYFHDLLVLSSRWEDFMDEKNLFEPGWVRESFNHHDTHWVLLYPDLVEDWPEYSEELERQEEVSIYLLDGIPRIDSNRPNRLITCKNLGEEFGTVARLIRHKLDNENIPPCEIVISIPELDHMRYRLLDTFKRYDIPVSIHAGLPLSNWPFGSLLQRLKECSNSKWSYDKLKVLLLDPRIPWKNRETIQTFLEFGRKYRCVSGYEEKGMLQDVWETSFDRILSSRSKRERYGTAQTFWRKFKNDCLAILGASNFTSLKDNLQKFKTNQFDKEKEDQLENQVVSRILEEAKDMAHTAERLALDAISSPFSLFLGQLRAETYVPQEKNDGAIHVYPYRVSAGIDSRVHIIMNANQDSLSIPPRGTALFPEPLRKLLHSDKLHLGERYINAYCNSGEEIIFTMSEQGLKGYTIPHIALSSQKSNLIIDQHINDLSPDPWKEETLLASTCYLRAYSNRAKQNHDNSFYISHIQHAAWEHLMEIKPPTQDKKDFRVIPLNPEDLWPFIYEKLIHDSEDPRLSPTDLTKAGGCPFAWLLTQGLNLDELSNTIETVEQREVGILYHDILENLFLRMKNHSTRIRNSELDTWLKIADEECTAAIKRLKTQEGSFQDSVYEMLSNRISSSVKAFIGKFLPSVEEASIMGVEMPLSHTLPDAPIRLSGIADLVLLQKDESLLLADFKTNYTPKAKDLLLEEGEERIANYQLATYILMLEKDGTYRTSVAWFYSMDKRDFTHLLAPDRPKGSRGALPVTRDNYQKEIDSLGPFLSWICSILDTKTFPILPHAERGRCRDCTVRSVCRIPYTGED